MLEMRCRTVPGGAHLTCLACGDEAIVSSSAGETGIRVFLDAHLHGTHDLGPTDTSGTAAA